MPPYEDQLIPVDSRGNTGVRRIRVPPDQREHRLRQLASALGVNDVPSSQVAPSPIFPSTHDEQNVEVALRETRLSTFTSRRHILRRSPAKGSFKRDELSTTLERLVHKACSPGQAQALVRRGADVNISRRAKKGLMNRLRGRTQEEKRSNVLEQSAECGRSETLAVLAPKSSQENLDKALSIAVRKDDLDSMTVLLHFNADPNSFEQQFLDYIRRSKVDFASSMINAKVSIDKATLTKALLLAVPTQAVKLIQSLLQKGADVSKDSAKALSRAIEDGNRQVIAALCLACNAQGTDSKSLSSILAFFANRIGKANEEQLQITELLLSAGATGPQVHQVLANASKLGDHDLVETLTSYVSTGIDTARDDEQAFLHAIQTGDRHLFASLLSIEISTNLVGQLLPIAINASSLARGTRQDFIRDLLNHNPNQRTLDTCLNLAVKLADEGVVQMLVRCGATTNLNDGAALLTSVSNDLLNIFPLLVQATPSMQLKLRAFEKARAKPKQTRLFLLKTLCDAGTHGTIIPETLVEIFRNSDYERDPDYDLIEYLASRADVNVANGECFYIASKLGDNKSISLLLKGNYCAGSIGRGLSGACTIPDYQKRRDIISYFHSHPAEGDGLHQAVLASIDTNPKCLPVLELLMQFNPNLELEGGRPLREAVNNRNLEVVRLLTERGISKQTFGNVMLWTSNVDERQFRYDAFKIILTKDVSRTDKSSVLDRVVEESPTDGNFLQLLLDHGADPTHKKSRPIRSAVKQDNRWLFTLLITNRNLPATAVYEVLSDILELSTESIKFHYASEILSAPLEDLSRELGSLLPKSFPKGTNDLRVLELLLAKGADVSSQRCEAIHRALSNQSTPILKALLSRARSPSPFIQTWNECIALDQEAQYSILASSFGELAGLNELQRNADIIRRRDRLLIDSIQSPLPNESQLELLLKHGANVHAFDDECLHKALELMNLRVFEMLLENTVDQSSFNRLFEHACSYDVTWTSKDGPVCLELILQKGVELSLVHQGLLKATQLFHVSRCGLSFVECLLAYGGSPDFNNGEALIEASNSPSKDLWRVLVQKTISHATLIVGLKQLLENQGATMHASEMIDIIILQVASKLEIAHEEVNGRPMLFWCLTQKSDQFDIFTKLIELGADINQEHPWVVYPKLGEESISILTFAILKFRTDRDSPFTSAVVKRLINSGANVNASTPKSHTPLVHLALRYAPAWVLDDMLSCGVDLNCSDRDGISPLRLASRRDDAKMIERLCDAGAQAHDGSLNDAARICNAKCIEVLIRKGHDPNFPSPKHDSRNAMAEILALSQAPTETAKIINSMRFLVLGGLNRDYRSSDDKSWLFLAIDSPCAATMTACILSAFIGDVIDSEVNIYRRQGYTMSALRYVKCLNHNQNPQKEQLLRSLESYNAQDVWYRKEGKQPDDYCGAPPDINRQEKERRHKLKLQAEKDADDKREKDREKADLAHRLQLDQEKHRLKLRQDQERHDQQETIAAAELENDMQRAATRRIAEREEEQELARRRREIENDEHRRAIEHLQEREEHERRTGQLKIEMAKEEGREQIRLLKNEAAVRTEEQREKNKLQQRFLQDSDSIKKQQHAREMEGHRAREKASNSGLKLMEQMQRMRQIQPAFEPGKIIGEIP